MNRKLLTQTINEWRSNLWLAVELLIVSVVVWYAVDFCYITCLDYSEPINFEIDHCYKINILEVNDKSPDYVERTAEERHADRLDLLDRLRRRPEIEIVSGSNCAYPYNSSNSSNLFRYDTIYSQGFVAVRYATPDFVRMFRYRGANGETPDQLAEQLERHGVLVSSNLFDGRVDTYTIDSITMGNEEVMAEGGSIAPVRYTEFAPKGQLDKTVVRLAQPDTEWQQEDVCVRVRDNMDTDFAINLMADADKHLRSGNFFIGSVESFDDIRENIVREARKQIISMVSGIAFLLVNVFLGLFGTFWFRTQHRIGEIAIRKVNGATHADIFRRFIGEGLVILTVVTVPAIGIDALLSHNELSKYFMGEYLTVCRLCVTALITYALMALMIVCGIAIPAGRAMRLNPATALHDE